MRTAIVLLILLNGLAAEPPKGLEGEWTVTDVLGDSHAKKLKENVKKVSIAGETLTAGRESKYTADAAKSTIDMTIDAGPISELGKYLGVYELKGDELKLHFAMPGKERPSGFTAKDGSFVIVLKKK